MQKIRAILDKVDVLPPSPSLLPKLLPYLGDVNANFDEVVRLISLDQTLTAKLLQICNSAFFGQDEPVATVNDAVNRVGYQSVYLLTAMISGSGSFPAAPAGSADNARLWKHSVATAFNTKFVAESAGLDGNLLLTAGLMHDIGKQILAQISAPLNGFNFHLPTSAESFAAERTAYECNHAEVGALLLEKWNLPPRLVAGVRHHHNPADAGEFQDLAACVSLGNFVTHNLEFARHAENAEFATAMKILRLDASHLPRWRQQFEESRDLITGMSKLPA
jgi:putative nucleotidyltransferase with HDIG domain